MQWICYTHNSENIFNMLSMQFCYLMAHVQVHQALSHSYHYKYHYLKVKIQPPVLHAVLGNLNPLFLDEKA
jgi:hypothetical protein